MIKEEKDTYNFEYWPNETNKADPIRVSFDKKHRICCSEFQKMCKAFALALGYSPKSVEEFFPSFDDDAS